MYRPPRSPTLFPYTTLFRSDRRRRAEGTDPQEKWAGMRGEDISVKVLEVDKARNRLILSEREDRKSTRLNSSHVSISYAVFCLKKKNIKMELVNWQCI